VFIQLAAIAVATLAVAWVVLASGNARLGARRPRLDSLTRSRVAQWTRIVERESRGQATPSLVLAVIARESGGDANAHGRAGELGLMQLTVGAWTDYARETGDPDASTFESVNASEINIRVGAWFLSRQIEATNSRFHGLRAYNCGLVGSRRNPTCGADYASWILEVAEPEFKGAAV